MVYHEATLKDTETAGEQGDYKLMHIKENGEWVALNCHKDYTTELCVLAVSRAMGKQSFSEAYATNQTNLTILTPVSGKRLLISGVFMATEGAAGTIGLDFLTSTKKVFRFYASKTTQSAVSDMAIRGAANEVLSLNTTTGLDNVFILVNYRSID